MANDRLRDAMIRSGLTASDVAGHVGVDPETAKRWFTRDRAPYPRHRTSLASLVQEPEAYLWPGAGSPDQDNNTAAAGVVRLYPRLSQLPDEVCWRLLDRARHRVGLLAYTALFRPEQQPRLVETLAEKAAAGVRVEILLGDPTSTAVAQRGVATGSGDALAAQIRIALAVHERLRAVPGVAVHLHRTVLYNSIYRFDDDALVNPHIFDLPDAHTPVLHLRPVPGGGLFRTYLDSFDRVWSSSVPAWLPSATG